MSVSLFSEAVVFEMPGSVSLRQVELCPPLDTDLLVDVVATGISSGTEKLLWDGTMPEFPGMGYPLVPGYEAVGRVVMAGSKCSVPEGTQVFIPGASCYVGDVRGLFGASASRLIAPEMRVTPITALSPEQGVMLALAATAMHVFTSQWQLSNSAKAKPASKDLVNFAPQLIVGHGVLGRLLARICVAIGAEAPIVWEIEDCRRAGAMNYEVIAPEDDPSILRNHIVDVSGATGGHFNTLIGLLSKGGRLTLAGFYNEPINFDFAPAFMREVNVGISAEWAPHDLTLVLDLVGAGKLSLDGLITHQYTYDRAAEAYSQAFNDSACLKTLLNWSA